MSKSKIQEYNILDAITIAIDVFKTQGYQKWLEGDTKPNKEVLKEKLIDLAKTKSLLPDYTTDMEYIFELKKELVFKKLSGSITDYETQVLDTLEKSNIDVRHMGVVASLPLMAHNIQKKEARRQKFEYYQENSNLVGMVGSEWAGPVTLLEKTAKESKFGQFWILVFDNDNKNIVKWLTNSEPECEVGKEYMLTGLVKEHKATEWYGNETLMKKCRLVDATNN